MKEIEGKEEVYCPRCMGDYLVGEITTDGQLVEPEVGQVVIPKFSEGSQAVLICRECGHQEPIPKEKVTILW